jgi:hypothetical protein
MVSFDGEVKLLDFGIARAGTGVRRTRAGVLKGKFAYLSPEQAAGGPADQRSDLFAVGILLHEMLTGSRLFSAPSEFETLDRVRSLQAPSVCASQPHLPPALDAILGRALAKAPAERFASAAAFASELRALLAGQPTQYGRADLRGFMQREFPADFAAERDKLARVATFAPVETEQQPAVAPHTPVSARPAAAAPAPPARPAARSQFARLLLPFGIASVVALGAVALLDDTAGPATGDTTIGDPVVKLQISPPTAQVFVQGKRKLGAGSSQSFRIPPTGLAVIDLFAPGHAPRRLEIDPSKLQGLPIEVTLAPTSARLVVTADADAQLSIDGSGIADGSGISDGSGSWTIAGLDPYRPHELLLTPRGAGLLPLRRQVIFDGFGEQRLQLRLPRVGSEPEPAAPVGWLTTDQTDGPYRLLIDGRDVGLSAPISADRPLPLKPGQRRITFVRGPHRKALLVTIVDGQTALLHLPNPQTTP